jgi:cyclophilin family peptidyl-prolyl cis-trans isomerase
MEKRFHGGNIKDENISRDTNAPGTLSMANTGSKDSGGSQFFLNVANNKNLDWFTDGQSKHPVRGRCARCTPLRVRVCRRAPRRLTLARCAPSDGRCSARSPRATMCARACTERVARDPHDVRRRLRSHSLTPGGETAQILVQISKVKTDANDNPATPIKMNSITITGV